MTRRWAHPVHLDAGDSTDRQLVVEVVAESEHAMAEVFTSLDKVVTAADAIFASNTSSIPMIKLGMATSWPNRCSASTP